MDKYECINKLKSIYDMVGQSPNNPNVYILHGELTDQEMNCLYNNPKVKVHVSFSHGEGFGMPLLEASLSGKPVLTSGWSGQCDFLDSKLCKLLPYELKQIPPEAVNEYFNKDSQWAVINYTAAGEIMKNVFNHYDFYLPKAEELRKQNMVKFSIQEMDKQFWALLDKYIPTFSIQNTIVLPKLRKIALPSLKKIESPVASSSVIIPPTQ